MKIGILTIYNKDFLDIANITKFHNKQYAQKNNYPFFDIYELDDFSYEKKQEAILRYLPEVDWMFYIDVDALIMNHKIKLEEFVKNKNSDFIAGHGLTWDKGNIVNPGVFFIKNSEWSVNFLNKIIDLCKTRTNGFDNEAIDILVKEENLIKRKRVERVSRKLFNSYGHKKHWDYKEGDFVLHVVGSNNEYRLNVLEKYKNKIIV